MTRLIVPILALALTGSLPARAEDGPEGPLESGVVEQVETRLAQFQVVLTGPSEKLASLDKDDLELVVDGRLIEDFTVDRLRTVVSPGAVAGQPRPATYVFYFDQPMLTPRGRHRALELSRELIPRLISGDDRGMIVSNGTTLMVFAEPTSDHQALFDALDRIEDDAEHYDDWAIRERSYVDEVRIAVRDALDAGSFGGYPMAAVDNRPLQLALFHELLPKPDPKESFGPKGGVIDLPGPKKEGRPPPPSDQERHQRENTAHGYRHLQQVHLRTKSYETEGVWRAQRSLARLRSLLSRIHDIGPPKSLLFFADILRFEPGAIYYLGGRRRHRDVRAFFDQVILAATAQGVRFYAVETGGRAFLRGVDAETISERIRSDLASLYLLSFDASGLDEDAMLSVDVRPRVPGLEVHTGGRLAIESEEARIRARLLAAYLRPGDASSRANVSATVIPTGYNGGLFHALVQVSASGVPTPRSTWEVGASLVSNDRVCEEVSQQITVGGAGVPITFEREVTFAPGPFELVAVVRQKETDEIGSRRIEGAWPDLEDAPAAVGPIAVIQPSKRVLVRGEETRTSGALAVDDNEAVRLGLPTAFVSLVCRHKEEDGELRVHRSVAGSSRAEFDPVDIESEDAQCAVLTDMVPARTLGEGDFLFTVEVLCGSEPCARGERTFSAIEQEPR
jgi:hypothetical protein